MSKESKQVASKRAAKPAPKDKSLESWVWDAACSICGAKNAPNGAERDRLPGRAARRVSAAARIKYQDYHISPSRYLHTGDADLSAVALAEEGTCRPIGEIVEELKVIDLSAVASAKEEAEAKEADKALRDILRKIGG